MTSKSGISDSRTLHILTRLITGGADENTILSIQGLQNEGCKIELLVGGESDKKLFEKYTDVTIIEINELVRNINPVKDFIAFHKIFWLLKKSDYQIVHTHTAKAGIIGRLAAKLAGINIIIHTLHGITFHDNLNIPVKIFYKLLEKITGRFTDCIITVGDDIKERYIQHHIAPPEKFVTIRSGFDISAFLQSAKLEASESMKLREELGVKSGDILIGCVSRLEPRKGHTYLFQAIEKLSLLSEIEQSVRLIIAGEGSYRTVLEKECEERGIGSQVRFIGFREDIARVMSLFDIIALTSLWEGLPRVLVQAALLGKPIVTFNVEGAHEVVHENVNGFVVPSKNVEQFTQKLAWMILNLSEAQKMGLAGKKIINNNWDTATMTRQIKSEYEKFLNRKLKTLHDKNY